MRTTQCERIVKYMEDFGGITSAEAMSELSCFRLASRINDLRRLGVDIRSEMVTGKNRYGEKIHFKRYFLGGGKCEL